MRWIALFIALILTMPIVSALNFTTDLTADEEATFDQILQPVMKVYSFVKYVATALAVVILLFAGVSYMLSGSDPKKRDQAKNMSMYVIIGLFVIWAAPLIVDFIVA